MAPARHKQLSQRLLHRGPGENGAILLLLIPVVMVLLILFGVVFGLGYRSMVRNEIQNAVDLAALGGAANYCSSKRCYEQVKVIAHEILKGVAVHGGESDESLVEKDPSIPSTWFDPYSLSPWISPDQSITVSVERGRWIPGTGFESFDERDPSTQSEPPWPTLHPGIPPHVAANAVQVSLQRSISIPLLSIIGASFTVRGSALAIGEPVVAQDIAPFAMPVCAILDPDEDFHVPGLCRAERLFTGVNRFCDNPGDPGCGNLPSFTWKPLDEDTRIIPDGPYGGLTYEAEIARCNDRISKLPTGAEAPDWFSCNYLSARYCFGKRSIYTPYESNFGVIGGPASSPQSETDILGVISGTSGVYATTTLGTEFTILKEGFKSSAAESTIWDEIRNYGKGRDDLHPFYYKTPLNAGIPDNNLADFRRMFVYSKYAPDGTRYDKNAPASPTNVPVTSNCVGRGYGPGAGFCNSRRFGPNPSVGFRPVGIGKFDAGETVWSISIPVIADSSDKAIPCSAIPSVKDGVDHKWEIIGFLKADIYDLDIGNPPPASPASAIDPTTNPWIDGFFWPYGTGKGTMLPFVSPYTGPWGFSTSCNLVRAITRCDRNFIPGRGTLVREPILVE